MRITEALGIKSETKKYKRRYVSLIVIITGILSIGFGIITFYGLQTGSFAMTMKADARRKGIQISETSDFEIVSTRLFADPLPDVIDITFLDLNVEEAIATDGDYRDPNGDYIAYTFYVRNSGREMVHLRYTISHYDVYKELDDAIRIYVIENDLKDTTTSETRDLYKKADEEEKEYYGFPDKPSIDFVDDNLVTEKIVRNFQIGQVRKITFLIWIEGQDSEDHMRGGGIKFKMEFSVLNADD